MKRTLYGLSLALMIAGGAMFYTHAYFLGCLEILLSLLAWVVATKASH